MKASHRNIHCCVGKQVAVLLEAILEDYHKNLQFICYYSFNNTQLALIYHKHILCYFENCILAAWDVQNVLHSCICIPRMR